MKAVNKVRLIYLPAIVIPKKISCVSVFIVFNGFTNRSKDPAERSALLILEYPILKPAIDTIITKIGSTIAGK